MPKNRLLYVGTVLIVAAASVWLGAELTRRIEWAVPYVGGAGIFLIVVGMVREVWTAKPSKGARPTRPA